MDKNDKINSKPLNKNYNTLRKDSKMKQHRSDLKCVDNLNISSSLTDIDRLCLSHTKDSYISAPCSTPSASSSITFKKSLTKT
ncbi:unnamed protein product [Adineta steineri]|uniref:Uncharacterized protein n=1 Tax=Adineta steineri TaxID=433720 RepID=A0A819TG98_9BILA|nr:unnamed protein product [Adineta steineri]